MKKLRKVMMTAFMALITTIVISEKVSAKTFENTDLSAAAAGAANAVVASSDDISSVFFNAAGLAWQEGVQTVIGNQSRYRNNNVDIAGSSFEGDLAMGGLNVFAISWLPKGTNFGAAISMATPYSVREDWGSAFPSLGEMKLNMRRYSADAFWRMNNTLGVSAGLDIYDSTLLLNTNASSFSGSGFSNVSAHAGVRWEFLPFWAIGGHIRQGANMDINGSNGSTYLQLPDVATLGVSHILWNDELLLELDIKRSTWSSFGNIVVTNNASVTQNITTNLRDTTDIMLGATWFWRNNTQLRFGYGYEQGANQTADYQPMLSDLSGHRLTAGFGGMMYGMHLDMAYTAALYNSQPATGAYAGYYSDARYSFMFSLSKKF